MEAGTGVRFRPGEKRSASPQLGCGYGFRGGYRILHAPCPVRSASLRTTGRWQDGQFEVGRAAAAGRSRSNRACTLRRTKAVRRGRKGRKFQQDRGPCENPAKRFSWREDERRNERAFCVSRKRGIWRLRGREPSPNADSDLTSQGLSLGPPYHKQIRHAVPFGAQAPFFSTAAARLKLNCPVGAKESPPEGFFGRNPKKRGGCITPPTSPAAAAAGRRTWQGSCCLGPCCA